MMLLAFTVFDSAAGAYMEPFFAKTIEIAIRSFRSTVNKEGHPFATYPDEYTLYHIGSYNEETGQLVPQDPRSLGVALTFVDKTQLNLLESTNDG